MLCRLTAVIQTFLFIFLIIIKKVLVFFSRTLEIRKSDYYYFFFLETKRPGIKIPSVTDTVDFTSSSDEQKRKLLEEIIF